MTETTDLTRADLTAPPRLRPRLRRTLDGTVAALTARDFPLSRIEAPDLDRSWSLAPTGQTVTLRAMRSSAGSPAVPGRRAFGRTCRCR
ncbi:hypothetical protein ACH4UM_36395 [Streptomyces sp. NPDC020801]|uniref:hypothetical protein n=1 Tax=Streptomyces sp. NPDC020801 TaxID=3365093 RepID=UPI00379040DC